jgi:hypothetical protein
LYYFFHLSYLTAKNAKFFAKVGKFFFVNFAKT